MTLSPYWSGERKLFRSLVENSKLLGWITNADGYCSYLSSRWYEFTGQTEASASGMGWLESIHPDDRARTQDVFLTANAGQLPYSVGYRLRRAGDGYSPTQARGTPRFDEEGRYLGFIGLTVPEDVPFPEKGPPVGNRVLTPREREVVQFMADGFSDAAIAERLGIAPRTVAVHIYNAVIKLGATNRVHACMLAAKLNEIEVWTAGAE